MRLWMGLQKRRLRSNASLFSINRMKKVAPNAGFRVGGCSLLRIYPEGLHEDRGRTTYGSPSFFQFSAIMVVSAFRCPSVGSFILPLFSSATKQ